MPDTVKRNLTTLLEDVLGKLVTGIPDKTKFVVQRESSRMRTKDKLPETLMVTSGIVNDEFLTLMLEILNKRWRTLDLISMMEELKRSFQFQKSRFLFSWGSENNRQVIVSSKVEERGLNFTDSFNLNMNLVDR
ncbi:hypothetical protein ACROYT_G036211 [Oculina patagonica]